MDQACRKILALSQELHEPLYTAMACAGEEQRYPRHCYTEPHSSTKLSPGHADGSKIPHKVHLVKFQASAVGV